jgi:uncharacterized repeat protein (TIGR03803 family)
MTRISAQKSSRLKTAIATAAFSTLLTLLVVSLPSQAQTYAVLHNFAGAPADGRFANGELIQDAAGNVYGTTYAGGTDDNGTIFKLEPSGGETILHNFTYSRRDGFYMDGGLLLDTEGNLYGTAAGSEYGGGSVFKLDTSNTLETLLIFAHPGHIGVWPQSRLVTIDGDLYGITQFGGNSDCVYGCGLIFKMTKRGTETVLYQFTGGADGAYPQGLIRDSAGNLYGVTKSNFTTSGAGTVFKLDTAGVFTVLYTFTGGADGKTPIGRLTLDANGNIHGVTAFGGDPTCNCGVVFRLDANGNETVLHKFFGFGGGSVPSGGLLDVGGTLYGTTLYGGDPTCSPILGNGCGVLFQIGKTGQYTVLHRFAGAVGGDGDYPNFDSLTLGADRSIYGATWYGGNQAGLCGGGDYPGCGTIFKYTPASE